MEQKNIEVQRKKGLNLMMKILITGDHTADHSCGFCRAGNPGGWRYCV